MFELIQQIFNLDQCPACHSRAKRNHDSWGCDSPINKKCHLALNVYLEGNVYSSSQISGNTAKYYFSIYDNRIWISSKELKAISIPISSNFFTIQDFKSFEAIDKKINLILTFNS